MSDFKNFETDLQKARLRMRDARKYNLILGWRNKKTERIAIYNADPKRKGVPKRDILGVFAKRDKLIDEVAEGFALAVNRFVENGNRENLEANLGGKVARIAGDNAKMFLGSSVGDRYFPSNSTATIKRKGRNTPMVATEETKDTMEGWLEKIL